MCLEIFGFRWFYGSTKLGFHRIINKMEGQKIKKIRPTFLVKIFSQIVSQYFYKIGLNPKQLDLLEKAQMELPQPSLTVMFTTFIKVYCVHVVLSPVSLQL